MEKPWLATAEHANHPTSIARRANEINPPITILRRVGEVIKCMCTFVIESGHYWHFKWFNVFSTLGKQTTLMSIRTQVCAVTRRLQRRKCIGCCPIVNAIPQETSVDVISHCRVVKIVGHSKKPRSRLRFPDASERLPECNSPNAGVGGNASFMPRQVTSMSSVKSRSKP